MKVRCSLLAICLILSLISCSQRDFIDLSGVWESSLGECVLPGTTDENKLGGGEHDTTVTSQLTRLYPYSGVVSYTREVVIPERMQGKRLSLYMERTKPSSLWVDGELQGSIRQLYAPHVYELPPMSAGRHKIRIDIDNSPEAVPSTIHGSHAWTDATQTNWNGILGRFGIEATPRNYIKSVNAYPALQQKAVVVKVEVVCGEPESAGASLTFDCKGKRSHKLALTEGENTFVELIYLGDNIKTWSEFHPYLYELEVCLRSKAGKHSKSVSFGMREFATEGTQFTINGFKTFLSGTHDACVFPLTGYAPTDVDQWRRLFRIAKQYGINHYRFHSYTPTEAAFQAADLEGIYLMAELPLWGSITSETVEQNEFLRNEAFTALEFLGNHPSFMALGLGNELFGDRELMNVWLDEFRAVDDRHLYYRGSNNNLGWNGPMDGEDFYVTCRVGAAPNEDFHTEWADELNARGYGAHARTSFGFVDADQGGILNVMRPGTQRSFENVVPLCPRPIVSHETCQFQVYPDYSELPKYTGVLYPYNLEIFRNRLEANGLSAQIQAFHSATGKWAVECYKADMEYCMRTPGFGGYQLLDIKDYPGQGTALVGILDAFMDSKGLVTADEFAQWNSPVVPMAKMDTYCWSNDDTLSAELVVSNYEEGDYSGSLDWTIEGEGIRWAGSTTAFCVPQGGVGQVGKLDLPLSDISEPQKLSLRLKTGKYSNEYKFWVYPAIPAPSCDESLVLATACDQATLAALEAGKSVLLIPEHSAIEGQSVGGLFTPDYWNYAMFKTISENAGRPVSPGTLGMLMDAEHPLFRNFPTEGRSSWQWWSIALNSRPLILDKLDKSYLPIIQTVDNVERNHKLGILMEFKVGKGRLLLCTTDLAAISPYIEGRWYARAIISYMASDAFQPTVELTPDALAELLYSTASVLDIQGVKNISDYSKKE